MTNQNKPVKKILPFLLLFLLPSVLTADAYRESITAYLKAKTAKERIIHLTRALATIPSEADESAMVKILLSRAYSYMDEKEFDSGFADMKHAIQIRPSSKTQISYRGRSYGQLTNSYRWSKPNQFYDNDPGFHLFRANHLWSLRDLDGAVDLYKDVIRSFPKTLITIYDHHYNLDSTNALRNAVLDYTEALKIQNDFVSWYYNRSRAQYFREKYSAALSDINEAIRLDNTYGQFYELKTDICLGMDDISQATTNVLAAMALSPQNPRPYLLAAGIYDRLGEYYQALKYHNLAVEKGSNYFSAYFKRAEFHQKYGKEDLAEKDYQEILRIAPTNAWAMSGLGFLSLKSQDLNQAKIWFSKATNGSSMIMQGYLGLADIAVREKDLNLENRLLGTLRKVFLRTPYYNDMVAYYHETRLNHASAISNLVELVKKKPAENKYRFRLADQHLAINQTAEAKKIYEEMLSENSTNRNAMNGLVNVYLVRKEYETAISACDMNISKIPSYYNFHVNRLIAGKLAGISEVEETSLKILMETLSPFVDEKGDPYRLVDRAYVYLWAGKYAEALADIKKILEREPRNPVAMVLQASYTWQTTKDRTATLTLLRKAIVHGFLNPSLLLAEDCYGHFLIGIWGNEDPKRILFTGVF